MSESVNLLFDPEGRVLFPEKLLKHAKIKTNVLFVGLGKTFQIWSPEIFEKFKVKSRKKAFENRSNFKWNNNKEKNNEYKYWWWRLKELKPRMV